MSYAWTAEVLIVADARVVIVIVYHVGSRRGGEEWMVRKSGAREG
jgi:hypothetical protein